MGQRAYSIRTRIKTLRTVSSESIDAKVREHIPLEQGLRLLLLLLLRSKFPWVREHIPLEQGLRLFKLVVKAQSWISQRAYSIRTRIKTYLRETHPTFNVYSQRAYSIRTRIKTEKS